MKIPTGIYKHYKGAEYLVIMMAKCADTKEDMVVYRGIGPNNDKVWVREASQWNELVTDPANPANKVPRFEKV